MNKKIDKVDVLEGRVDKIEITLKLHEKLLWVMLGFALANFDKIPAVFKLLSAGA